MQQFLTYLFLLISSILGVYLFKQYALHKGLLDNPNHRSSHTTPTPRGGGIVFITLWLTFLLSSGFLGQIPLELTCLFLIPTAFIGIISYLDDRYTLSAKIRFGVQILASIIALYLLDNTSLEFGLFSLSLVWLTLPIMFFSLIWSTNLFNFMDGMDGFAGTEAVFVLGIGSLLIYLNHGFALSYVLWALVILILGFLVWNKPKAKIFMGDVGSASLGFIILLSGLAAQKYNQVPFILWLMLYGIFLFDATITLIRRVLNGETWHEAHRKHAYQRLNQAGWSHGKVMIGLILINMAISSLVLLSYYYASLTPYLFIVELVMLIVIYLRIEKLLPQNNIKKTY
jgi:Fuc2NAc and GlcNAc transferase